jgi:hypothetical protein
VATDDTYIVNISEDVTSVVTIEDPDSGGRWNVEVVEDNVSVVSVGIQGPEGPASTTYIHSQSVAASSWSIAHNLGKYPSVSVVDSAGNVIHANVSYTSDTALVVTFTASFSGTAYLN